MWSEVFKCPNESKTLFFNSGLQLLIYAGLYLQMPPQLLCFAHLFATVQPQDHRHMCRHEERKVMWSQENLIQALSSIFLSEAQMTLGMHFPYKWAIFLWVPTKDQHDIHNPVRIFCSTTKGLKIVSIYRSLKVQDSADFPSGPSGQTLYPKNFNSLRQNWNLLVNPADLNRRKISFRSSKCCSKVGEATTMSSR